MKELRIEFEGIGEVREFKFKQLFHNGIAYLYQVEQPSVPDRKHYEVFLRTENTRYDCVSYPKSNNFGKWAWTFTTYDEALIKYNSLKPKAK